MEKIKDLLTRLNESPEGQEFWDAYGRKLELKKKRFDRFTEWLNSNSFDDLLYRLIVKHDDDYRERCFNKGFEPYMNRVMGFVFDYATSMGKPITAKIKGIDCDFPYNLWEFNDYYFQIIYGQGSIVRIFNKQDMRLIFAL